MKGGWHVKRHDYDPAPKLTIHPDSWKWAGHEKYKSREYEGHGWWRGGKWIESSNPTKPLDTHRLTAGASDVLAFLLSSCSATIHSAERIWLLHFTMGNIMKMLRYALTASALLALAPTAASAADFGPYGPGPYVERPVPTPPAYYVRPYYPQPYYDEAYYYGARFRRPYPYVAAYPYWRGPRFAYYGHRPYWRGHWGGRGRRW